MLGLVDPAEPDDWPPALAMQASNLLDVDPEDTAGTMDRLVPMPPRKLLLKYQATKSSSAIAFVRCRTQDLTSTRPNRLEVSHSAFEDGGHPPPPPA